MTWAAFWWPNIAGALVSVGVTTLIGVPLGLVGRRVLRRVWAQWLDGQERVAVSASQTAQHAAEVVQGQSDVVERLAAVEGAVDGMRDGVSASLGHRAREDVRFRRLEDRLADVERTRGKP